MDKKKDKLIANELNSMVKEINSAWQEERFEDLMEYFHEDIVISGPNFEGGEKGRRACIKSFKQFLEAAEIHQYNESDFNSLVWDNTAVVHYAFDMSYSIKGQKFRDKGFDLYVFSKENNKWKAIWRTLIQ